MAKLSVFFALSTTPSELYYFQANMPPSFLAKALQTTTYLLNCQPSKVIKSTTLFERHHNRPPSYSDLCVFNYPCYPNLSSTASHKLSPRSTTCVFLGYPSSHKGYRCLEISTRRIIISRHVIFDESVFPFAAQLTLVPLTSSSTL